MKPRSPWRRAGAGALVGALLAMGSLQAVLEVRETADTRVAFEGKHLSSCLRLHDHRFCVFTGRSPWSCPHPVVHLPARTNLPDGAEPVEGERPAARPALVSVQPRSPPLQA